MEEIKDAVKSSLCVKPLLATPKSMIAFFVSVYSMLAKIHIYYSYILIIVSRLLSTLWIAPGGAHHFMTYMRFHL